jgi:hypothetical protein
MRQRHRFSSSQLELQTHLFVLAARFARALLYLSTLSPRGRREDRVLTSHPRSAARRCSAKRPHSSIQVWPNTRPSLRSGLTAYAVLSREPNSFWPPSPRELTMWLIRLDAPHLRENLTVATTAGTTRFCRTRICLRHRVRWHRARRHRNVGAANFTAPSIHARFRAHRDYPPCPHLFAPTLPRPPHPRLANVTTYDRPSRSSRDERHIRHFRISVKLNIFVRAD